MQSQRMLGKLGINACHALAVLFLALIVYSDFVMPNLVERSDFLSCIWTGAKLISQGRWSELYVPFGASNFTGAPCDIAAHQFLPHLPPQLVAEFNYCPLVGVLLVPFSYLPPNMALFVWQVISVGSLAVASWLFSTDGRVHIESVSLALIFLPVTIAVWIGQSDLVLGLLVLAFTYRFLVDGKDLAAGLISSLFLLKMQFVIAPGVVALVLMYKRQFKFLAGLLLGSIALIGANVLVSSPAIIQHWFYNVRLCERVFTDPLGGLQKHLIISLPGALLLSLSKEAAAACKPITYLLSLAIGCVTAAGATVFSNRAHARSTWLTMAIIVAILAMPLVIPNYVLYDYSLFAAAGMLVYEAQSEVPGLPLTKFVIGLFVGINCYAFLVMFTKLTLPALLLIPIFLIWLLIVRQLFAYRANSITG